MFDELTQLLKDRADKQDGGFAAVIVFLPLAPAPSSAGQSTSDEPTTNATRPAGCVPAVVEGKADPLDPLTHSARHTLIMPCQFWPERLVVAVEPIAAGDQGNHVDHVRGRLRVQCVWLGDVPVYHSEHGLKLAELEPTLSHALRGTSLSPGQVMTIGLNYDDDGQRLPPQAVIVRVLGYKPGLPA